MDLIGPIGWGISQQAEMPDGIQHPDACDGTLLMSFARANELFLMDQEDANAGRRRRNAWV